MPIIAINICEKILSLKEIPDEFLVGYGLDYMGKFRNLPHLAILNRTEPKAVPQR